MTAEPTRLPARIAGYRVLSRLGSGGMGEVFLLESTGRGPEAHRELKRALVTDALSVPLNTELGCNSYYQRHYDEAIRGYREALTLDAGKQLFVDPYLVATIYLALNDKPRTFEQLEKAYDLKSGFLVSLASEPKWDSVRQDAQFKDLVKRVGF